MPQVGNTVRVWVEKTREWVDGEVKLVINKDICVFSHADGQLDWRFMRHVFDPKSQKAADTALANNKVGEGVYHD